MARFSQSLFRPGVAVMLLAMLPSSGAVAASPQREVLLFRYRAEGMSTGGAMQVLLSPGHVYPRHQHATCSTGHFLYAESEIFAGPTSIAGYVINADCSLTPTPGSPYPTGGTLAQPAFGVNKIAATQANGPCVFRTGASGQVESFKVAADGALTQVSSVTVADGSSTYGGDTHSPADGKFLYVAA